MNFFLLLNLAEIYNEIVDSIILSFKVPISHNRNPAIENKFLKKSLVENKNKNIIAYATK